MKTKDYRESYFKDGRLTGSFIIRKDTEAFVVRCAAVNTIKGERCQVQEMDGPLVWDWTDDGTI